jgi:hypothetical protein
MNFGGLVVRWADLGYAVAHPDHPLSTPLVQNLMDYAQGSSKFSHNTLKFRQDTVHKPENLETCQTHFRSPFLPVAYGFRGIPHNKVCSPIVILRVCHSDHNL